jgi:hypothetical protein
MKKLFILIPIVFFGCDSKLCSCIKETAIKPNNDIVVIGEIVKPDIDCYQNRSIEYTKIDSTEYYYRYIFKCEE